jgi:hypothetical protein
MAAVNAWRLRMKVSGKKEPYLNFLRELVISIFTQHGTTPVRWEFMNNFCQFHLYFVLQTLTHFFTWRVDQFNHRKRKSIMGPCAEARFDDLNHWSVPTELDQKQQLKRRNCNRCALEGKRDLKLVNIYKKCFKERIFVVVRLILFFVILYTNLI